MKFLNYKIVFVVGVLLFSVAGNAFAASVGDVVNFNVDKGFDVSGRTQISASLVKVSPMLYFYVEKPFWDAQSQAKQAQILNNLDNLSAEFNTNIYSSLTSLFGSEWNPGIDGDSRITVIFESMSSAEGGYFRETDEYDKLQLPNSNQREMLYLSTSNLDSPNAKIILAHEFTHLITFNQKNKSYGVEEDTWLNEARADYSSTILGYDNAYSGSNLAQRVSDFIENPSDSITDWSGTKYDYASVDLFMHYLVDHYGINILSDSLKSRLVGIASINQALLNSGSRENFSQIFTDWTIALTVNDCSQNSEYCYSDKNLKNLKVNPTLIFLPLTGSSSLSETNVTKNWSGNWQKVIGGNGDLKLDFSSLAGLNFEVPYIVYDKNNNYSVKFLALDSSEKGEISIPGFGTKYNSLIILPSLQTQSSGFDNSSLIFPYSFTVSIAGQDVNTDQATIQKLLDQIASLKKQIAAILAQRGQTSNQSVACQISGNISFGVYGSSDVKCLQQFLLNQGSSMYQGLVTGYFGPLTKAAVIKFQEKYASDILTPQGLSKGTGSVDNLTRQKINNILNGK
jgi:peptidoglycan hydrolase-like protein with peptidoglycan-binding domain